MSVSLGSSGKKLFKVRQFEAKKRFGESNVKRQVSYFCIVVFTVSSHN